MSSILATLTPAELASYPLQAPPTGVHSNFGEAENNNKPMFVVLSVFLAIMMMFFSNRIYTKSCIVRRYSWDDVTITLAVACSLVCFVAAIWGGARGRVGYHIWDISFAQFMSMDYIIPVWIMIWMPTVVYLFLKNTFFIMYLHIFGPLRWLRLCAYIGIAFTSAFYIAVTVAMFIFATPRSGETWPEHLLSKEVGKTILLPVPISSFGVVTDLAILALPIIAVMQLQLPTRRKIGVSLIFMTGALACLFSILNIPFRNIEDRSKDHNWDNTMVIILTVLEVFIGIICACAPSAAKSYTHNFQHLDALKVFIFSRLSRTTSTIKQSGASLLFRKGESQPGQYSEIDVTHGPGHANNAQGKSIRTFIQSGRRHDIENDGIHLTFEMQNQFTQADHTYRETLSSLEPVVTRV